MIEQLQILAMPVVVTVLFLQFLYRRPHDEMGVWLIMAWLTGFFVLIRLGEIIVELQSIHQILEKME